MPHERKAQYENKTKKVLNSHKNKNNKNKTKIVIHTRSEIHF